MRKVLYIVAAVAGVGFVGLLIWARNAPPPSTLGVHDGSLSECPGSPNCVSSQTESSQHQIEPITFAGDATTAMERIRATIDGMSRTKIVTHTDKYLHAEFRTSLIGYIDDLECLLDSDAGTIHIRSASRLGHSDLGANRKRVEAIRTAFAGQ